MIRLLLPTPMQLSALLRDPTGLGRLPVVGSALPPRVVLDQARSAGTPPGRHYRWLAPYLIVYRGHIVGSIGGKGLLDEEDEVEIGYNVTEEYQRQGIATQAIGAITQLARTDGLRVLAHVEPDNEASRRALLKNGYRMEAVVQLPDSLALERWRSPGLSDEDDASLKGFDLAL